MYTAFFGLKELPFNNTPDPRFFFPTPDHEEALASVIYAVSERKGFVLVTGEVGAGKTLVARMMAKHFASRIAFANINHATHGPEDLMEAVCSEFELSCPPNVTNTGRVRVLHDFLLERFAQNIPVVLILDEAQGLSPDAFEQLRMIGNLEADDAKLLQIVILGQPELGQVFQTPELRQLRQRIFRCFHLPRLGRDLTSGYIRHRLRVGGSTEAEIFSGTAIESIFRGSEGVPRVINTICDNALLSAYSADRKTIDGPFIDSVIAQMMTIDASAAGSLFGDRVEGVEPPTSLTAATVRSVPYCDEVDSADGSPDWQGRQIEERFEELSARIEQFEAKTSAGPAPFEQAIKVHRELATLIEDARKCSAYARTRTDILTQRGEELGDQTGILKEMIAEAREVADLLKETTADSRLARRSAQEQQKTLVRQSRRTGRLATTLEKTAEVIEPYVKAEWLDRLPGSPAAAVNVNGDRSADLFHQSPSRLARFQRILSSSRRSLADLRCLINQNGEALVTNGRADSDCGLDSNAAMVASDAMAERFESVTRRLDQTVPVA